MQMTGGEKFIKKAKCKNVHCSSMSNSTWCDLNSKGDIIKLHDKCPNPKCDCQKLITFTPHQCMLDGGSIKSKFYKIIKGTQTAWNKLLKSGLKLATQLTSATKAARTKNPQSAQITSKIKKLLTGGKVLSLTDMHGNGLR